jgi:hypothetical protein
MAAVASVAAGYIWEDPGDSIMIQVRLDLVERLNAAVQQGLGAGSRGNEIGGILLGRRLPGFGRAVLIEDFELVHSEHFRGASYTLSPGERHMLGGQLRRRRPWQVVGFFRSHTRPGLYLDQDDFFVFNRHFQDDWQVFLLVRPSMEGPAMGGFFFWEDGEINKRSPYRQFPFDAKQLAVDGFPIADESCGAPPAPRLAPVAVPKVVSRAPRKLPTLPWVVVPAIAALFLIAGLFVSQNQAPTRDTAGTKASPPVEPLLPEPVPQVVSRPAPAAAQEVAPARPDPFAQAPAAELKSTATPKITSAQKSLPKAAEPSPVTVARMPSREVEPPPLLAVPIERVEPKLAAVLPPRVSAAPAPEAEVSFEAPRPGVFRRALHKIEGAESVAFVPPSPIRQVAPMKPANAAESRPVDVKVFIDESGSVTRAQLLTKGNDLSAGALNAARQWQFTPARKHDRPVVSEMVLHFRFGGM